MKLCRTNQNNISAGGSSQRESNCHMGLTSYAYDARNRLTGTSINGIISTYAYDNNGNMLSKNESGSLTTYQYGGYNRLTVMAGCFMDFKYYIKNAVKENNFVPTGITKRSYIDILGKCLSAYSFEDLENRLLKTKDGLIDDLQAFSRITCALGVMIADGRMTEYKGLWTKMMDACCRDFYRRTPPSTLDFAVKEIMLSYKAMKNYVNENKKSEWLENLARIEPYRNYSNVLRNHIEEERLIHTRQRLLYQYRLQLLHIISCLKY